MQRFLRLLTFVQPFKGALAVSFAAAVLASLLDGFTYALLIPFLRLLFGAEQGVADQAPTLVEHAVELVAGFVLDGDPRVALIGIVVVLLGAIAVKNVALFTANALAVHIQEGVGRDLRARLYRHIQTLGLGFFLRRKAGQLVSRMLTDVEQACRIVSATLVSTAQQVFLIAVYVGLLLALSWRMALAMFVMAPLITLTIRPILRNIGARVRQALHNRGELTAVMGETVEGIRLVKAHGAEEYERRRFEDAGSHYSKGMVQAHRLAALAHPLSETLGAGVVVSLVVAAMLTGIGEGMRPELFIPFVAVALRLLSPVKAVSQFPVVAELSLAAADRVFEILDEHSQETDPPGAREFRGLQRAVVFEDVWCAYAPNEWALQGVNLDVPVGEVIAIVGPSGAGKSTLVDLLPRFIEPSRGRIIIDGTPITEYSRRSLRRAMGIVSQHTVIFNDTVTANIAYGDQGGASAAAVEAAARAANAHGFIERLPNGYDTVLGERGMTLSGGERQRIAIARALLRDPPILILDEATSALDSESERLVQAAMRRLLEGRTVFVIAHRFSTVARADQIVVLHEGRVVERGRHDDLVLAGGLYQRLHALDMIST